MKLEIGKCYRTRNGLETGPMERANNGTNYKFGAWVKEDAYEELISHVWLETGEFISPGIAHRMDLVEKIRDGQNSTTETTTGPGREGQGSV